MDKTFEIARNLLLAPAGITDGQLEKVLYKILGSSIDEADLYFQSANSETWVLEDGIVKEASYDIERGVGVRAVSGEKAALAYSDDIILPALEQAAHAARSIAYHGGEGQIKAWHEVRTPQLYPAENPLNTLTKADKIALLQSADREARSQDSRVIQVGVSLSGVYEVVLIMSSDGSVAADIRPLVRMNVSVIVEQDGRRESGSAGGGGRFGYSSFMEQEGALYYAREAVRQAVVNLHAREAPVGVMPVILGPGWPGILLHEAVGHGLEGDFNRKGSSAFSGRLGERVASPLCTVVDNGTLPNRRGSLTIDDEGVPSQCTVLIENGILKNYMQDKMNAKLMGMKPTGNGRRESYAHLPMPRMTNTYLLAGPHEPEEMIASVKRGLYAVNFGGGQVDITSGKFVFSASEAYLIENGKVMYPVKGATLMGNGPDVLTRVSMLGHDLQLDKGVGVCGKEGQSVPVGVGQPTVKVDAITVGGTGGEKDVI